MWWPRLKNGPLTNNVPVDIAGSMGTNTVIVNQAKHANRWVLLDTVAFAPGTNGWVRIRTDGTKNGSVSANAIRFLEVGFTYLLAPAPGRVSKLIYADEPMESDLSVLRSMRE